MSDIAKLAKKSRLSAALGASLVFGFIIHAAHGTEFLLAVLVFVFVSRGLAIDLGLGCFPMIVSQGKVLDALNAAMVAHGVYFCCHAESNSLWLSLNLSAARLSLGRSCLAPKRFR